MLMALIAGAAGFPPHAARAAESEPTLEHRVKAAFLYRFAEYVEWPQSALPKPDTPLAIAVAGAPPLAAELARTVKGRTVRNHSVIVRQVKPDEPLAGVHLIFVGREHRDRLKEIASRARERAVLVVTDWDGALAQGSMVNFVIVDDRVRFEVGLEAARGAGLKLSSRLLAVAQQVYSGAP